MHDDRSIQTPYAASGVRPRRCRLAAGAYLFHMGDPVHDMVFVAAGALALVRTLGDGRTVPVGRAAAGELVAEASLFAARYHCDGVATVASEVLLYRKAEVLAGLAAAPERMLALVQHLSGQVRDLRARIELLSQPGAEDRILAFVAAHADQATGRWAMDRTWKVIAGELGLSHEAVYRALARLERAGRLERTRKVVRLVT